MGNYLQGAKVVPGGPGSALLKKYRTGKLDSVKESYENLVDIYGVDTHNVNSEEFEDVFGLWIDDTDPDFAFWASGGQTANVFVCFCGMTTFCDGKLEHKLDFIFNLFDFDQSSSLSADELVMLMRCVLKGMCSLTGLPLNLRREDYALKKLAAEVFKFMDADNSGLVEKSEFIRYVLSSRKILEFLHTFQDGTDVQVAIKQHQDKWVQIESKFKLLAKNNLAELNECMNLLHETVADDIGRAFTVDEKVELTEQIDCQGKVSRFAFEALAKGLIAFDIMDVAINGFVYLVDLAILVHIKNGKEPDCDLLASAAAKMGEHNNDDDIITRLEWIKFCALPKELGEGYYEKFSDTVKELFDKHDVDKSGLLDLPEFSNVLYDSLVSVTPGSVKDMMEKEDSKKSFLRSMAESLAIEIFDRCGVSKRAALEWLKLKSTLGYLWDRKNEVMRWMYDHQTDHFARILAFDKDKNGLDLEEMEVIMFKGLAPSIKYQIITAEEARSLARVTAEKIIEKLDKDGDQLIAASELEKALETCVLMEREMMDKVERIRSAKINKSIRDRHEYAMRVIHQAKTADNSLDPDQEDEQPKSAPADFLREELPEAANVLQLENPIKESKTVKPKKKKAGNGKPKAALKAPGAKKKVAKSKR